MQLNFFIASDLANRPVSNLDNSSYFLYAALNYRKFISNNFIVCFLFEASIFSKYKLKQFTNSFTKGAMMLPPRAKIEHEPGMMKKR